MSQLFSTISNELKKWIEQQKVFFVATAPLAETGHINCSPKGLDTFRVIDETTVVYEDLIGSGAETIAHIQENKRIVIMFCAFEGSPKIVRLHGNGLVITPEKKEFNTLQTLFSKRIGVRAYIKIYVSRISDSCGYAVPLYEFKQERKVLDDWFDRKGKEELQQYIQDNNNQSIDGLKGL